MPRQSKQHAERTRRIFDATFLSTRDLNAASHAAGVSVRTGRRWRTLLLRSLERPKTPSLAGRTTSFEGRTAELEELTQRLASGGRLVTVLGPPGIGKTRLISQWLDTDAARSYGEGLFCDLRSAQGESDLHSELARRLEAQLEPGAMQAVDTIGTLIAARGPCVVFLDNLEQFTEVAATAVARWLVLAPEVRFVATSRRVLRLESETVMELGPLRVPLEGTDHPGLWDENDAMRLFWKRASVAEPSLRRRSLSTAYTAELVRRLDGVPLAIELAAAQMRRGGLAELLQQARESTLTFESPFVDADPRHATVSEAIGRSWQLLSIDERTTLAQLTVFHGGFSLDAAAHVLECSKTAVANHLAELRESSLLRVSESTHLGRRFDLLQPIREFAKQRLSRYDRRKAERRHASHYLHQGSAWEEVLQSEKGLNARRWLSAETENLRAAFRTLSQADPIDSDALANMALVLAATFAERMPAFAVETLARALEAIDRSHRPVLYLRVVLARARVRREAGQLASAVEDLRLAKAVEQEISRRQPPHPDLLRWRLTRMYEQGFLAFFRGRSREARTKLEAALSELKSSGRELAKPHQDSLAARIHVALAWVLADEFHDPEAFAYYARAVHHAHAAGDERQEAWARLLWSSHRAIFSRARGTAELEELSSWATRLEVVGDHAFGAYHALALSFAEHVVPDRRVEARTWAQVARERASRTGLTRFEGAALLQLGLIEVELGRLPQATHHLDAANELHARIGEVRQQAVGEIFLGGLLASAGDVTFGQNLLRAARSRTAECGDFRLNDLIDLQTMQAELALVAKALAAGETTRARSLQQTVRSRMSTARHAPKRAASGLLPITECSVEGRHVMRTLEKSLHAQGPVPCTLRVTPDGSRFALGTDDWSLIPDGPITRRALCALVEHRKQAPGRPMVRATLVHHCWPDERMRPESEQRRVRHVIKRLRSLGLADVIKTGESGGYYLDPEIPIVSLNLNDPTA